MQGDRPRRPYIQLNFAGDENSLFRVHYELTGVPALMLTNPLAQSRRNRSRAAEGKVITW
jgi:hypothetical protein